MSDRYSILFQPMQIGPVTAPNRFYQVPHCSGMGHRYPESDRAMRFTKAEGGWGVISTQETEIHPSSDITPSNQARIWDDRDLDHHLALTDGIHRLGSLAAIQLAHNGKHAPNRLSRIAPYSPSACLSTSDDPLHARAMTKEDIKAFRRWHRDAALRAKRAGYDIVYVYAGHDMTLLQHFLLARHNHRTDEYGGSFENRLRLFREVIADTRDAVGDTCALAIRLAVEELLGAEGIRHDVEGRDIVAALAEEPDLWDVNLAGWSNDSMSARFSQEGFQEEYIRFVKTVTTKPVVGVGRYTSPDAMVRAINQGVLDLIGAARPSIADPFLPTKIKEGRVDEIRECIGCNICVASDNIVTPMRCTQNPTIGEEGRKAWHPEFIRPLPRPSSFLVVGGGPAGLEASRALAQRGAEITLVDARSEWGGRVSQECVLPGMASYSRVRDWRLHFLKQSSQVSMFLESQLSVDDVFEFGMPHIVLATGSSWRTDGVGRVHGRPLAFLEQGKTIGVDAVLSQGVNALDGVKSIVVFDDDRYYMGSMMALVCAQAGIKTTLVTPSPMAAPFMRETLEHHRMQTQLLEQGVTIIALHQLADRSADQVMIACSYTGKLTAIDADSLMTVGARTPNDRLYHELLARQAEWADHGIMSVDRIGDCLAPSTVAAANYEGHKFAQEFMQVLNEQDAQRYR